MCNLLGSVSLVANPKYRAATWGSWWVEPYTETCASIYDDQRIEEFAGGDAAEIGFDPLQVGALNEFLHSMDRLTEVHKPGTIRSEDVVKTEEWREAEIKAGALLAVAKSWSARHCADPLD